MQDRPQPNFYFFQLTMRSIDESWGARYIENRDQRITEFLKELGNEFWQNYRDTLDAAHRDERLLLRTKHFDQNINRVIISQVWRSKSDADAFVKVGCRGLSLDRLLADKGISMDKTESTVDESFGAQFAEDIIQHPYIVSYIVARWSHDQLKIGDPLKSGRLHLPNP